MCICSLFAAKWYCSLKTGVIVFFFFEVLVCIFPSCYLAYEIVHAPVKILFGVPMWLLSSSTHSRKPISVGIYSLNLFLRNSFACRFQFPDESISLSWIIYSCRFHLLVEFDEVKRSCRKRLDGHNKRRRKPQPCSVNSGS